MERNTRALLCSRSYHAAPIPKGRPTLGTRTSSVKTIFAEVTRDGGRSPGHEQLQFYLGSLTGEIAQSCVALQHRFVRSPELLHLQVVVHQRQIRDPTVVSELTCSRQCRRNTCGSIRGRSPPSAHQFASLPPSKLTYGVNPVKQASIVVRHGTDSAGAENEGPSPRNRRGNGEKPRGA